MTLWTLYDSATGAVIATGSAPNAEQANLQSTGGGAVLLVVTETNPETQKVTAGAVVAKPAPTITASGTTFSANGVAFASIGNIPSGSLASIEAPEGLGILPITPFIVTGTVLEITTTVAGVYVVTISKFPNKDYVVTLNAT